MLFLAVQVSPSGEVVTAPFFPTAMFLGSMCWVIWKRLSPKGAKALTFAVASGLIVGEGLMGVVKAVLTLLGVPPWI